MPLLLFLMCLHAFVCVSVPLYSVIDPFLTIIAFDLLVKSLCKLFLKGAIHMKLFYLISTHMNAMILHATNTMKYN